MVPGRGHLAREEQRRARASREAARAHAGDAQLVHGTGRCLSPVGSTGILLVLVRSLGPEEQDLAPEAISFQRNALIIYGNGSLFGRYINMNTVTIKIDRVCDRSLCERQPAANMHANKEAGSRDDAESFMSAREQHADDDSDGACMSGAIALRSIECAATLLTRTRGNVA